MITNKSGYIFYQMYTKDKNGGKKRYKESTPLLSGVIMNIFTVLSNTH